MHHLDQQHVFCAGQAAVLQGYCAQWLKHAETILLVCWCGTNFHVVAVELCCLCCCWCCFFAVFFAIWQDLDKLLEEKIDSFVARNMCLGFFLRVNLSVR